MSSFASRETMWLSHLTASFASSRAIQTTRADNDRGFTCSAAKPATCKRKLWFVAYMQKSTMRSTSKHSVERSTIKSRGLWEKGERDGVGPRCGKIGRAQQHNCTNCFSRPSCRKVFFVGCIHSLLRVWQSAFEAAVKSHRNTWEYTRFHPPQATRFAMVLSLPPPLFFRRGEKHKLFGPFQVQKQHLSFADCQGLSLLEGF